MSKHRGGAPVAYSNRGGQSSAAREKLIPTDVRNSAVRRALHADPARIAAQIPRLPWAEVIARAGKHAKGCANADTRPVFLDSLAMLPKELAHQAALALYDCRAPVESIRAAVERAWILESTVFAMLAGDETFTILRHCQFKLPYQCGPVVTIWRGARGVDLDIARAGRSWSLDRRVAVAWVEQLGIRRVLGRPLVIKRTARREDVIFYTDENEMQEVVIDAAPAGEIDGDEAEWHLTARAFAEGRMWLDAIDRAQAGT